MSTQSRNKKKNRETTPPKITRRSRFPAWVRVPVPPERLAWQRPGAQEEPYRQITQARAVEITGKSAHTVKRWANGTAAMDSSSLRLLQMWVWGILPAPEFSAAGIFIAHQQRWRPGFDGKAPETLLATDTGYLIGPSDLQSFGWLQGAYQAHWAQLDREKAQEAAQAPAQAPPSAQVIPFAAHLARRRALAPDDAADLA